MDITTLYKIYLECTSVTTDSRNCPEGSLFIALKGDNFNGNAFAAKALESGSNYKGSNLYKGRRKEIHLHALRR